MRVTENERIAQLVEEIHRESPDKGYRRIRDDLDRYYHTPVNDKRTLRICRSLGIQSAVKHAPQGCTRAASSPRCLAENVLGCRFFADRPNEKWLTDVTEFHYYAGSTMRKLYLSAILDLCDRRIVSYVIRDTNDAALVHSTLDQALKANPGVHPLLHSDRGSAYTTPPRSSITNWPLPALLRACLGRENALTTAPWRASGAFSNGNDTTAVTLPAEMRWCV